MNNRSLSLLIVIVGLTRLPVADASQPTALVEIDYLLGYIGSSGCEFYRNGSWYDSKRAEAHLRSKYELLSASEKVDSAEEFVDKVATKSSFSGLAYEVRCSGHAAIDSKAWLLDVLTRHRIREAAEIEMNAPLGLRGASGIQGLDSKP